MTLGGIACLLNYPVGVIRGYRDRGVTGCTVASCNDRIWDHSEARKVKNVFTLSWRCAVVVARVARRSRSGQCAIKVIRTRPVVAMATGTGIRGILARGSILMFRDHVRTVLMAPAAVKGTAVP